MDLISASFTEISKSIRDKKISAVETTKFFLKRIESLNPKLNAYLMTNPDAEKEALAIDQKIAKGEEVGLLAGIPFGIKDMFCTKNLRTTAASKILENFIPPYDSTVVARLRAAGVVVLGKLNQDEFAMGSSNETSYFGAVKNPWNLEHVPGGSSGGSSAAQAARIAAGTLGTDTGGSIRQPSSFCGIVGIKPTYGRVSRYGIISYASSLDQAGPMVSSVEDAALTLEVISGRDPMDSTTSGKTVPSFSKNLNADIKGMKIGLVKEFQRGNLDPDVQKTFDNSMNELKKMGVEFIDISIPLIEMAVPVYYLIATAEASSNLARYDGVKYGFRAGLNSQMTSSLEDFYSETRGQGFGMEVKRRIMLGTYCLSSGYYDAYYNKACQVRRLLRDQYLSAFKKCDVILSPVYATPAFKIGGKSSDPVKNYLNDIFTTATNLAGLPGMSVPFGISSSGLPIGVQLTTAHFEEQKILNMAYALEKVSPVKGVKPHVI